VIIKNSTITGFIKNHPSAVIPSKAHKSDSGYDLVAVKRDIYFSDKTGFISYVSYDTGIVVSPPDNIYLLLYPRSSIRKYDMLLCNSVGVIDTSYRGNIIACFTPTIYTKSINDLIIYNEGDRIAQLIPQILLDITFKELNEVDITNRGGGGFGSSGT